jgi:NADH-quinone oxidoreductase B subunit
MAVKKPNLDSIGNFEHPLYNTLLNVPGLSVATGAIDEIMSWGLTNAMWIFPMATSCCGIEFMATAASRVDIDRMGSIPRGSPRQADVMVVAGTITVKMAPRVLRLWEQMPEPKWCIAMGSCAISGDFYRNLYSVVPGVDTFLPVDVYVPGCPPSPETLMHGMMRLQEKVRRERKGETVVPEVRPELMDITKPSIPRLQDATRTPEHGQAQLDSAAGVTRFDGVEPLRIDAESAPTPELLAPDFEAALKEVGVTETPKEGPPLVKAEQHLALAKRLKALGYTQYVTVVASHWLAGKGRKGAEADAPEHYEVATVVRSPGAGSKTATWTVRVNLNQSVPSLYDVYPGADWQEREQWDLVGVAFSGHPDLRRLMMPEKFTGHPLRRDFPSDAPYAPWR